MLELGLRGVQYVLLIGCGVLLTSTFKPLVYGAQVPRVPPLEEPGAAADPAAPSEYQEITSRNLFKTAAGLAPAAAPVAEAVVDSTLSVKLVGVVAPSVAIIEEASGERRVVRVKDMVGVAQIERIEPRRLIVQNQGRLEALQMEQELSPRAMALKLRGEASYARVVLQEPAVALPRPESAAGAQIASAKPKREPAAAKPGTRSKSELPDVAAPPPGTRAGAAFPEYVSAETIQRILRGKKAGEAETDSISPSSRYSAVAERASDAAVQAEFSAIAGETWLAELSRRIRLEPGERIVEVNRIPTNDASRLPDLLMSLRRAESASVRIARDPRESRDIEVELP